MSKELIIRLLIYFHMLVGWQQESSQLFNLLLIFITHMHMKYNLVKNFISKKIKQDNNSKTNKKMKIKNQHYNRKKENLQNYHHRLIFLLV